MPITYKTHVLVGALHSGGHSVIKEWSYTPTEAEVYAAISTAMTLYSEFALFAPVGGTYPGNYVASQQDMGFCG